MTTRARDGLTREERLLVRDTLVSYARGWFPMCDPETGVVHWVQPAQRGVIPLDERFRVSRSLRGVVRSGRFRITSNAAFREVIRACAAPTSSRVDTWINDDIAELFHLLHRSGHAHSIEAWVEGERGPELVGGLYGLVVGSAFCGESMFCRPDRGGSNASKVCLVHLVEHLRRQGFTMLDCQLLNPHLEQFGCYEMPQEAFAERMEEAVKVGAEWGRFRVTEAAEVEDTIMKT
ncbi:MAG TPA: leucyl/phenylalanyl-tRNA--protein transferase [Phycisphaerales bacterium]|nr:leucyl/phenylalanyl-tRNA--protein transferase [Phycisphaerales bacterium]